MIKFKLVVILCLTLTYNLNAYANSRSYEGDWQGSILAAVGTQNYNLKLEISKNLKGKYSGKVYYTDLGCVSELIQIKESKDTLHFKEKLIEGIGKCSPNAKVDLSLSEKGDQVDYTWFFPDGRVGLKAELVVAGGNNSPTQNTNVIASSTQPSSTNQVIASEKEMTKLALQAIDEMAAHPDDPQNPFSVTGVTDEELATTSAEEIRELLEATHPYAKDHDNPRYLFALGRAAWIHDYPQANRLLTQAADAGSFAAKAYLARTKDDLSEMQGLLKEAVNGGFKPAREWLSEVEVALNQGSNEQKNVALDFNLFSLPPVIEALHNGDYEALKKNLVLIVPYLTSLNESLNNMLIYIEPDKQMQFKHELDPNISTRLGIKMMQNPKYVNEVTGIGMNMFKDMLIAMGNAHKYNQSPQEMITNLHASVYGTRGKNQQGKTTKLTLVEMEGFGKKDGEQLALLFNTNPDAFKKIYNNIKKFESQL